MTDEPTIPDNITYVESPPSELFTRQVRAIARAEVASLCGLVLRRLQDDHPTRMIERNITNDIIAETLSRIFGELLQEFGTDEPPA